MKDTILKITKCFADNTEKVTEVSQKDFALPSSWLWQGYYRGTDTYMNSAGTIIYVERT